mgnify:CR=1 FL=1
MSCRRAVGLGFGVGALGVLALILVVSVLAPESSAVREDQWDRVEAAQAHGAEQRPEQPSSPPAAPGALEEPPPQPPPPAGPVSPDPVVAAQRARWAALRAAPPELVSSQEAAAATLARRSVIELQPRRITDTARIQHPRGFDSAELINLNPAVGAWYVLTARGGGLPPESWHLSVARPDAVALSLDEDGSDGILVHAVDGASAPCRLFAADAEGIAPLDRRATGPSPYTSLCEGAVVLRRPALGRQTTREWASQFLRDNVKGGETLTVFVRSTLYADAWRVESREARGTSPPSTDPSGPPPTRLDPELPVVPLVPQDLGLRLDGVRGAVAPGQWRAVVTSPGVYAAAVTAGAVDRAPAAGWAERLGALDPEERRALIYLVAFDLEAFDLGFAVGTDHPRVDWSERALPSMRRADLPGPDGFATLDPLRRTGVLSGPDAERVAATFTGGFKRSHGAFKHAALAGQNRGSHYGFIEQGVVLSALQPGLSTLFTTIDGAVEMKTWTVADEALLPTIRHARQNGVPLVETLDAGVPEPGALVSRWGAGNWGGSQDEKLRTIRAGACILEDAGRRWLIYGWFSSATPGGMARVFLAQGCRYAMLLDMNALEHTYLALYDTTDGAFHTRHLVSGMDVLDKEVDGQVLPRFLAFSDNRDFFYLLRRDPAPGSAP